jgi:hypothetical protein
MATRESPPVGIDHPTVVPENLDTDPSAEDGVGEDDEDADAEPSAGE